MVNFDTKKLMVSLLAGLNALLVAQILQAADAKQAPPSATSSLPHSRRPSGDGSILMSRPSSRSIQAISFLSRP